MNTQKIIITAVAFGAAIVGVMTWAQDRPDGPAAEPAPEAREATVARADVDLPVARITERERADGFVPLVGERADGGFHKHGWNHYGPGHFTLDHETGVLASHGGMGLLWYAARTFGDFVLRLEFRASEPASNSGIFLRVPELVTSDEYVYHSFEIQIHATASEAIHRTGAVYDAAAPTEQSERAPGEWNEMEISFMGDRITVDLNDVRVNDWRAEPRGKVRDLAARGYIGLQNHDWDTSVYFRNIRVRALD
jgi:hypothetical protein